MTKIRIISGGALEEEKILSVCFQFLLIKYKKGLEISVTFYKTGLVFWSDRIGRFIQNGVSELRIRTFKDFRFYFGIKIVGLPFLHINDLLK